MHDRRIEGKAQVFGNQGALLMGNMTWWDHETGSIWSQMWGRALQGPLKGHTLKPLPGSIVPWATWKAQHPGTLLLTDTGGFASMSNPAIPIDDFVIGLAVDGESAAYPYPIASSEVVINDTVGAHPVLIYVAPNTRAINTFLRGVDGFTLTFSVEGNRLTDRETGSTWQPLTGRAVDGELAGKRLTPLPFVPAYDWAWQDFYPRSSFYKSLPQ